MQRYKHEGQEDCADCEWLANETEGEILICPECEAEKDDE